MRVVKRDGTFEEVHYDTITERNRKLCTEIQPALDPSVDCAKVTKKVVASMQDGITTAELDELSAEVAANLNLEHPDYTTLAVRICVSSLHKQTKPRFSEAMEELFHYVNPKISLTETAPRVSSELIEIVRANRDRLDAAILPDLDYNFDYFGFMTLRRAYVISFPVENSRRIKYVERPSYMYMRISLGIHGSNIEKAIETYQMMARHEFTHATPTMYNSGTPNCQMSSCFLTQIKSDSIRGIYETLLKCAEISKFAGGMGISVHHIRAQGSYIRGSGGISSGLFPLLKNYEQTARYVDQGGGKRKGSFCIYLEPWHADILEVLRAMDKQGLEAETTKDLSYAMWVPGLFMERVKQKGKWSLFCPNEAPGLHLVYGEEFRALYEKYEQDPTKVRATLDAYALFTKIITTQINNGKPFFLYKDACNFKSNHRHLGTIQSSNLCTEIVQYTSPDEIAVCNLASVNLVKCLSADETRFDFQKLASIVRVMTRNLNNIIDRNFYPVPEAEYSNRRHRPIGIGIQGLADVFAMLHIPFESEDARLLNLYIFETMYYAALDASCQLAEETGLTYDSYVGSPIEKEGKLQFDLWADEDRLRGRQTGSIYTRPPTDERWPWTELRGRIRRFGLRNSLLLAPMPTASTAQILGNAECFDPYFSNMFTRRVLAGTFIVVNRHLVRDLQQRGLWNAEMKDAIIKGMGSVQNVPGFPEDLKPIYKTVYEISQKTLIQMAADRGRYICQSQSLNLYFDHKSANTTKVSAALFMGYELGLKTGCYYIRTLSAKEALQFTVENKLSASSYSSATAAAAAEQVEENVIVGCDNCGV